MGLGISDVGPVAYQPELLPTLHELGAGEPRLRFVRAIRGGALRQPVGHVVGNGHARAGRLGGDGLFEFGGEVDDDAHGWRVRVRFGSRHYLRQ